MTAEEFWKGFTEIFKDGTNTKNEAIRNWSSPKDYTETIVNAVSKLLSRKYQVSKEYYRIDLTAWKQLRKSENDKILYNGFEKHLWDLEVAVEHENSSVSWMDEVVKLLHINCPLRVVIGYLPIGQRDNHKVYLDKITEQIKETKAVNTYESLKKGEFMIIIGNSNCHGNEKEFCRYKAYVFDKDKFVLSGEI